MLGYSVQCCVRETSTSEECMEQFKSYQDLIQDYFNTIHTAGRREQTAGRKLHKIYQKNVKSVEFHDHIWNHHKKCIQKSTNMPGIGSLVRETDV